MLMIVDDAAELLTKLRKQILPHNPCPHGLDTIDKCIAADSYIYLRNEQEAAARYVEWLSLYFKNFDKPVKDFWAVMVPSYKRWATTYCEDPALDAVRQAYKDDLYFYSGVLLEQALIILYLRKGKLTPRGPKPLIAEVGPHA